MEERGHRNHQSVQKRPGMRILFLSPEYPPHHIGGGGVVVQCLARTFARKGHRVTVMAGYYPTKSILESIKTTKDHGVEVFWLPLIPTPRLSFQLDTIMPPNIFSLAFLLGFMLTRQYDIINVHGYGHFLNDFGALISKLLRRKYVATIHGIPMQPERQSGGLKVIFGIYRRTFGQAFLNWAYAITAVSGHTAQDTIVYGGIAKRIVVISNGVDSEDFATPPASELSNVKRRYGIEGKKLLLSVGRLSEVKGFQFLLRAMPRIMKEIPDAHLLIAGADGGYYRELARIIDDLGLDDCVGLIGEVEGVVKKALYSIAEVVVIPSIAESFGLVALEAMTAGKPVVASNVGGLTEILKDGRIGVLAKPADSESLAKAVIKILGDSTLWLNLSKASKETLTMYDWNKIANDYMKMYKA